MSNWNKKTAILVVQCVAIEACAVLAYGGEALFDLAFSAPLQEFSEAYTSSKASSALTDSGGRTLLHFSAAGDNGEVVQLLLANGADVNAVTSDKRRETPLHSAARGNAAGAARLLLEAGADLTQKDALGRSPMHGAYIMQHLDVLRVMLNAGADANEGFPRTARVLFERNGFKLREDTDPGAVFALFDRHGFDEAIHKENMKRYHLRESTESSYSIDDLLGEQSEEEKGSQRRSEKRTLPIPDKDTLGSP